MNDTLPTVEDIEDELARDHQRVDRIAQWLREHGYSALRDDECGCSVDDLAPCVDGPFAECHAAYWVECRRGDAWCDCDVAMGGSHCARDVNEPCVPLPSEEVSE